MRRAWTWALAAVACAALAAPAQGAKIVTGVAAPRTEIVPKDGAYTLVLLRPLGGKDKELCGYVLTRYGASDRYDPATRAYGLYWLTPQRRTLANADCNGAPAGVPTEVFDYQTSSELIRDLRLPGGPGPYLVVVMCEPNGTQPVNAGWIDLSKAKDLNAKFDVFERYLQNPAGWGKKRQIDRDAAQAVFDSLRMPARLAGRNVGAIKRMKACRAA